MKSPIKSRTRKSQLFLPEHMVSTKLCKKHNALAFPILTTDTLIRSFEIGRQFHGAGCEYWHEIPDVEHARDFSGALFVCKALPKMSLIRTSLQLLNLPRKQVKLASR